MSVRLAIEVRKTHNAGKLKPGQLGGGRSGQNTKYTLEKIRGDKVGWFNGDPCHDTSGGREATPLGEDPDLTGAESEAAAAEAAGESKCWRGTTMATRCGTWRSWPKVPPLHHEL